MPSTSSLTQSDLEAAAHLRRNVGYTWPQVRDYLVGQHPGMQGISYQTVRGAVVRWEQEQYGSVPRRRAGRNGAATPVHTGLTFGVEIEFRRPTDDRGYALDERVIAEAVRAAGIECQYEDYNHTTRPYWKLIYDGSSDKELVSPILSGADGLEQVRKVMQVLRNLGCRVTRSEGMHVHIGAGSFTPVQIARIAEMYTTNSSLFDSVLARTRRPGGSGYRWANHLTSREVAAIRTEAEQYGSVRRVDRYRSVNLQAHAQHGTVEFRQHQGTLNGTKATAWVTLIQAFVTYVAANDAVTQWTTFDEMAQAISLDARTTRFFTRRAASLVPTPETF